MGHAWVRMCPVCHRRTAVEQQTWLGELLGLRANCKCEHCGAVSRLLSRTPIRGGFLYCRVVGHKSEYAVEGGEDWHSKWDRNRQRALERAGHRCEKCGSTTNVQVHHKRKVTDGGTDSLRNLIVLCQACHSEKHPPPDWMAQMMKSGKWKKGKRVKRRATVSRGVKPGLLQRLADMF